MTEAALVLLLFHIKHIVQNISKRVGSPINHIIDWVLLSSYVYRFHIIDYFCHLTFTVYQNICLWFSESKTLIHLISCLSLNFFLFFILELLRTDHFTLDVTLQPWEYNRLLSHYKPSNFSIRGDCFTYSDRQYSATIS